MSGLGYSYLLHTLIFTTVLPSNVLESTGPVDLSAAEHCPISTRAPAPALSVTAVSLFLPLFPLLPPPPPSAHELLSRQLLTNYLKVVDQKDAANHLYKVCSSRFQGATIAAWIGACLGLGLSVGCRERWGVPKPRG